MIDTLLDGGTLSLGSGSTFDRIDLVKTAETGFSVSGGVLSIQNGTKRSRTCISPPAAPPQNFVLASDGHAGTIVAFV